MRVIEGCYVALRLVEHEIYVLLALQTLIVEAHLVGRQNLGTELGYNLTIYGNHTGKDEVVSLTTRAYARLRDEAVETNLARLTVGVILRIAAGFIILTGLEVSLRATLKVRTLVVALACATLIATTLLTACAGEALLGIEIALFAEVATLAEVVVATLLANTLATRTLIAGTLTTRTFLAGTLTTRTLLATAILGAQTVVVGEVRVKRTFGGLCRAGTELSLSLAVSLAARTGTTLNTLRRADTLTLIASKTRKVSC